MFWIENDPPPLELPLWPPDPYRLIMSPVELSWAAKKVRANLAVVLSH